MKYSSIKLIAFLFVASLFSVAYGQKAQLNLKNALVVGQMDSQEDRYSIEINLTEMLNSRGVKAIPSLNIIKLGADSRVLASDSISSALKAKGIDTYILVSVRGYDRTFKIADKQDSLANALDRGNLFEMYALDIVSVSFEFKFYRNGEFQHAEIVKLGNIGDRETVLKKFRKKVGKLIDKKWK